MCKNESDTSRVKWMNCHIRPIGAEFQTTDGPWIFIASSPILSPIPAFLEFKIVQALIGPGQFCGRIHRVSESSPFGILWFPQMIFQIPFLLSPSVRFLYFSQFRRTTDGSRPSRRRFCALRPVWTEKDEGLSSSVPNSWNRINGSVSIALACAWVPPALDPEIRRFRPRISHLNFRTWISDCHRVSWNPTCGNAQCSGLSFWCYGVKWRFYLFLQIFRLYLTLRPWFSPHPALIKLFWDHNSCFLSISPKRIKIAHEGKSQFGSNSWMKDRLTSGDWFVRFKTILTENLRQPTILVWKQALGISKIRLLRQENVTDSTGSRSIGYRHFAWPIGQFHGSDIQDMINICLPSSFCTLGIERDSRHSKEYCCSSLFGALYRKQYPPIKPVRSLVDHSIDLEKEDGQRKGLKHQMSSGETAQFQIVAKGWRSCQSHFLFLDFLRKRQNLSGGILKVSGVRLIGD